MWYYAQDGKSFGPISMEKLKELARSGALRPTDHVLPVGTQQWKAASTVEGLFPGQVVAPKPASPVAQGPPPRPAPSGGAAQGGMPSPITAGSPPGKGGPPALEEDSDTGPKTWSLVAPFGPGGPPGGPPPLRPGPWEPSFGRRLGRHFRRLFTWNLQNIQVDEDEKRFLLSQGVDDPTMLRYLTWRHSLLLVLVFPVFLLALLNTIDSLSRTEGLNNLGKSVLVSNILLPFALPFTALLALIVWYRPRFSWRLLLTGWLIGTAGPLIMHVFPIYLLVDIEPIVQTVSQELFGRDHNEQDRQTARLFIRFFVGGAVFGYMLIHLPIIGFTAVYGAQRACLRLKTLLPQSSIPGLFLAVTAPVICFLLFPFLMTISQLAPHPLLMLGMFCLMASPLIFTFFFKRMVSPLLEDRDFLRQRILQICSTLLFWLGVLLILIYAFTIPIPMLNPRALARVEGRSEESLILYKTILGFSSSSSWFQPWNWNLLRYLLVEVLGRSLFTMILVSDLFMRVNSYVWLSARKVMSSEEAARYDKLMERMTNTGQWDQTSRSS